MEERRRAGLSLTRFGLGLAALGRPAYMTLTHAADFPDGRSVDTLAARTAQMCDAAYAAGIRYFDAARSYGRAEEFLARWIGARDVVVGSKWGYRYTGDWQVDGRVQEVKEHSAGMLRAQAAESRAILGAHLRLYQIHSATAESGVLENREVLDELKRLRDGGLLLGLTVTGPKQADTIRRALEHAPLFSAVQATWNALERSAEPALREAHDAGLAVILKEPLANGRLAQAPGADVLALAFALRQPFADVVLLGAATPAQLASNLRAETRVVSPEDLAALESLRESPGDYWSRRAQLPWT